MDIDFKSKSINWRVRYIREELGLSQSQLAKSLGVGQTTVSYMEREGKKVKDSNIRLLCKTHRASYLFIKEGFGDPFLSVPDIIMDDTVEKYNLDKTDKAIIEEYVKLDEDTRKAFKKYLLRVLEKVKD